MTIPHTLYIRFLATKGVDDINQMNVELSKLRLPKISQKELDDEWALIHKTLPVNVVSQIEKKVYSADFLKNMAVLEIEDLWLYDPAFRAKDSRAKDVSVTMKAVFDIHDDLWLRTNINALLVKKVSCEEISRILSSKFSIALKEKPVYYYARYFFNDSGMTRARWKEFIKGYSGREYQIYFIALTETVDVLKTELDLPALVNVSDSLQWLLTKSFLKAKSYINVDTPDANREARAWIEQVVALTDKYEKHRSGDQHDFAKSLQMEFEFIDEDFATPDTELTAEVADKARPKDTNQTS